MAFNPPITHNDVAFSFGRIVGAASVSAFTMQLICCPSDIGDVSAITAPVDKSYVVYPPELILTNLVAEVPVVSIAGEILVFSVSPTSADFYVLKLLPLPHPSYPLLIIALSSRHSP